MWKSRFLFPLVALLCLVGFAEKTQAETVFEVPRYPRLLSESSVFQTAFIDVGAYSVPFAVDWDNDGDLDLLTGQLENGLIKLFRNHKEIDPKGENWFFEYEIIKGGSHPIEVSYWGSAGSVPSVVDWNDDGKKDLLIGEREGYVSVAINRGTDGEPVFDPPTRVETESMFGSNVDIDVGCNSAPAVWDWDGDGDEDLVVGAEDGYVHVYINEGNNATRRFCFPSFPVGPFGENCQVQPIDWDEDGTMDFVTASKYEWDPGDPYDDAVLELLFFQNSPQFDTITGDWIPKFSNDPEPLDLFTTVPNVRLGSYIAASPQWMRFHIVDWDRDGIPDILVGDPAGNVWWFRDYSGRGGPAPSYIAGPLVGYGPLTVSFQDRSTGNLGTWYWDFGDGSPISNEQNPSHTFYASDGTDSTEYDVSLRLSSGGTPFSRKVRVHNPDGPTGLAEGFQAPIVGWTRNPDSRYNLWKPVNSDAPSYLISRNGVRSFYYGQDLTGNYDTGSTNSGVIESPPIALAADSYALSFWRWEETESTPGLDKREVFVEYPSSVWTKVYSSDGSRPQEWVFETISLLDYAGETVRLRFSFDTVNALNNNYRGWFVDDISVVGLNTMVPLLFEDAEDNAPDWTKTGLWHVAEASSVAPSPTGGTAYWFGEMFNGQPSYNLKTTSGFPTMVSLLRWVELLPPSAYFYLDGQIVDLADILDFLERVGESAGVPILPDLLFLVEIITSGDYASVALMDALDQMSDLLDDSEIMGLINTTSSGERSYGGLDSPSVFVPDTDPYLTFWSWHNTEGVPGYDLKQVLISTDAGATWALLYQLPETPQQEWVQIQVGLAGYESQLVRIRFYFDTVDGQLNSYHGWVIDDIEVASGALSPDPDPQPSLSLADMMKIMRHVAGLETLNPEEVERLDQNGDDLITIGDLMIALQGLTGM